MEIERQPGTEQRGQMKDNLDHARLHALGDFKETHPDKALAIVHELEKEYQALIDIDPTKRLEGVKRLGGLLATQDREVFGMSKVIDGSAAHILAACIKDPNAGIRKETMTQLKTIVAKTPVTAMQHVVALNAISLAPKWGKLFSKFPKLPKFL